MKRSLKNSSGFIHHGKRSPASRMKAANTMGTEEFRRQLDEQADSMARNTLAPGQTAIDSLGMRKRRPVDEVSVPVDTAEPLAPEMVESLEEDESLE
jgi:hypothetical protein